MPFLLPTLSEMIPRGIFGQLLVVIALGLLTWLAVLTFRPCRLFNYVAFLAASTYPLLLGIWECTAYWISYFNQAEHYGFVGPFDALAETIDASRVCFFCGCSLTALFLPLGIFVLLARRPK